MDTEKEIRIACNRLFFYAILLGALMAWIGITALTGEGIWLGIGFLCLALICFAVLVIMPVFYRFDPKGITFCYLFVPNERYLWKNIRSIEIDYNTKEPTAFRLSAKPEGKCRFYMEGKVHKTRRTKRLLEAYWDGEITGYFFEGLRKWWRKRKGKQERQLRRHLDSEVVPMERAAREEARNALALYDAQAAQLGLKLRVKFCYTNEDFDEQNSRPEGNYTYTVLVELCRPGETDESRIIVTRADLLHVRLGQSAYRGVKDQEALTDLGQELSEMLDQVRKVGFDAYCKEFEE